MRWCFLTSGSSPWWCRPKWVGRSSVGGISVPAKSNLACMAYGEKAQCASWHIFTCWMQKHLEDIFCLLFFNCKTYFSTFLVPFLLGAGRSRIHSNFSGSTLFMWTHSFWGFTSRSSSVLTHRSPKPRSGKASELQFEHKWLLEKHIFLSSY